MIIDAPSFWIFLPQTWFILGTVLIMIEIFDGNLIALSFGISALVLALLLWSDKNFLLDDFMFIESIRGLLYTYGIISILATALIKFIFQQKGKKDDKDINIY